MGSHIKGRNKQQAVRIGRTKWIESHEGFSFRVPQTSTAWPHLLKRFEIAGFKANVDVKKRATTISVSASESQLRAILGGHARQNRVSKVWVVIPLVLILGVLASIPLVPATSKTPPAKPEGPTTDQCAESNIIQWLQGKSTSSAIQPLEISLLGGITAGTVQCKGSRYRYTLGSKEPKRVLNLIRLDT